MSKNKTQNNTNNNEYGIWDEEKTPLTVDNFMYELSDEDGYVYGVIFDLDDYYAFKKSDESTINIFDLRKIINENGGKLAIDYDRMNQYDFEIIDSNAICISNSFDRYMLKVYKVDIDNRYIIFEDSDGDMTSIMMDKKLMEDYINVVNYMYDSNDWDYLGDLDGLLDNPCELFEFVAEAVKSGKYNK